MDDDKTPTENNPARAQALLELAATLTAAADECFAIAGVLNTIPAATLSGLERRLGALGDACHRARQQIRKPGRENS